MFIGVIGRWPLIAFALLNGTRIGRVISLGILAFVVAEMINGPGPNLRAEAMKAGTFDCMAALNEAVEDASWTYCSGKYGETRWAAMFNANLDRDAAQGR
jgi:hypothetical protein